MRKFILCITITAAVSINLAAQNSQPLRGKSPLKSIVNFSSEEADFDPQVLQLEALPRPAGDYKIKKQDLDQMRRNSVKIPSKPAMQGKKGNEAPVLRNQFQGNSSGGTPNDNDVAVSNNGVIISVLNSNIRIFDSTGAILGSKSLAFLATSLGTLTRTFDPRVVYDPNNDRFIVVFLNGSESINNNPVICFSETNDPTGKWHCYFLPGNPFGDTSWSDYPIISLSDKDIFITLNLLQDDKGWKDGFRQSIIWQIDLEKGYMGDSLEHNLWSDIKYQGKPIWNICPAQAGIRPEGPFAYFVSVRPGDLENDTMFVHTIAGSVVGNNATIATRMLKTSQKYGLPPSAPQPDGQLLETNDARVLTAMFQNGLLHFAGNTRDFTHNSAGIYYGIMDLNDDVANLKILGFDSLDLGYPDIAYAGTGSPNDHAVIFTVSHVSSNTFPGTSVVSVNWSGEFSDLTRVKSGLNSINVLLDTFERWGDYAGIQRKYNDNAVFWLAGNYGDNINRTIIAKVSYGDIALKAQDIENPSNSFTLFPNPASVYLEVKFELNSSERIKFSVYDLQGREIQVLYHDRVKGGKNQFKFNTSALSAGAYILYVQNATGIIKQEKFVVIP